MELRIADRLIVPPSVDDVRHALESGPWPVEWTVTVETDSGEILDAIHRGEGRFDVINDGGPQRLRSSRPVDAHTLGDMIVAFMSERADWRSACGWSPDQGPVSPDPSPARKETAAGATGRGPRLVALALIAAGFYGLFAWGPGLLSSHAPGVHPGPVLFAAAIGLVSALLYVGSRAVSAATAAWPSVPGEIVASGLHTRSDPNSPSQKDLHEAQVEYAYSVDGTRYLGRQVRIGTTVASSRASASAALMRYPVGTRVEVHYDPANPANAALEFSRGFVRIFALVSVISFAIAAILVARG